MKTLRYWGLLSLCAAAVAVQAQQLQIKGTCPGEDAAELELYARPMSTTAATSPVKLDAEGERFGGAVPQAPDGFYTLYGKRNGGQVIVPLYVDKGIAVAEFTLRWVDDSPIIDNTPDNQALSAYNAYVYAQGRYWWEKGKEMGVDALPAYLQSYIQVADSMAAAHGCGAAVQAYLKVWAYVSACNVYTSIHHVTGLKRDEVPFKLSEVLPDAAKALDTPLSAYFPAVGTIIQGACGKGSLDSQLAYLYDHYQCAEVRSMVSSALLDGFIRHYDFSKGFDNGLAELTRAVEQYQLGRDCIRTFEKRRSSVKGADFPAVVTLVDRNGQAVDFSSFRGHYVYVDLWASWCGPCCKEVPHLQQLEKNMEGTGVKFVSISLDKNTEAWKKKMEALHMEGNQLLDSKGTLAEALNVSGIPYFVIYDKEGKLYMHGAPRPSHPALEEMLRGLP